MDTIHLTVMATSLLPLAARDSTEHLQPHSNDRERSLASPATSPASKAGDTATIIAWRNARDSYRKSLTEKDLKRILVPAKPEDVLDEIEKWQQRQKTSKYCKVAAGVAAGFSRLQRFNRAVDMIAQGSPHPGCLLWGSIIFALTVSDQSSVFVSIVMAPYTHRSRLDLIQLQIVQNAAEEYEKLCKAVSRIAECLPRIELYTETFVGSKLVQDCVGNFYCSILRFWTRACKFYRRRRLWNFVRIVWKDYEAEFGDLELELSKTREGIESNGPSALLSR